MLAWTLGNPDAERFKPYLDYTTMMFEMLEFKVQEAVVIAGTRTETANEQPGLGEKLLNVGARLTAG